MKGAVCIWLVSFLCMTVSVHCYNGEGYNHLAEFLKTKRTKKSANNQVFEDATINTDSPVYIGKHDGLKKLDKISMLPGQPDRVNFDQYSGYVTVDPRVGRALFYYFVESQNASTKPLILWMNGGPGCSAFGMGAMKEHGPFRVNPDGKTLYHNDYAWNKLANMIYLDSPAGVGFSYSNQSLDYRTVGDKRTVLDIYAFLMNWMERFSEYKGRDFYLTGENYAGHFIPQLATEVLKHKPSVLNFKGILIGNPVIDDDAQDRGPYEFWWKRSLIPDEIYKGIAENCNVSVLTGNPSQACYDYQDQVNVGKLYPYDIYAPFCSTNSTVSPKGIFDPCSEKYIHKYLNKHRVQKALHAINVTGTARPWTIYSSIIESWQDSPISMLPVIKKLMGSGIPIWFYSGDSDSVVSITDTMYSFKKLNLSVKTPWYPWYVNGEVGGYVTEYLNITLVTVKGSGHYVPSYKPESALAIFSSFLSGKLPPNVNEAKII